MCSTNHSAAVWSEISSFWVLMEGTVNKSCTLCIMLEQEQNSCPTCLLWSQWWGKGGCESRALTDYPAWTWAIVGDGHRALLTEGKLSPARLGEPSESCRYLLGSGGLLWAVNYAAAPKCKFIPRYMAWESSALSLSTLEKDTRGVNSCSLKGSKMCISGVSLSGQFLALLKLQ